MYLLATEFANANNAKGQTVYMYLQNIGIATEADIIPIHVCNTMHARNERLSAQFFFFFFL